MSMCRVVSCVVGRGCLLCSAFSWQHSVSLCPASFCSPKPNLPVISWLPTFASSPLWCKGHLFYFYFLVSVRRSSLTVLPREHTGHGNIVLDCTGLSFLHQTHPELGVISALAQPLLSFWSYFFALPQQHIGNLPTWGAHLPVSYLLDFSFCSWGS